MRSAALREMYRENREPWFRQSRRGSAQWVERKPRTYAPASTSPLAVLLSAIDASRALTELPDDWDDAGSPRIEESTWEKAAEFLKCHARLLYNRHGLLMPIPRILPGPDGSVDFHWRTDRRELLLNVPPDSNTATFYGDAYGTNSIKGHLDLAASDLGLFTWLTVTD